MAEIPVVDIPLDELLDEIDIEEKVLEDDRNRLVEARLHLVEVQDQQQWERLPTIEERIRNREQRIRRLEERIKKRTADIEETYRRIAWLQFRTPYPFNEIRRLRRRISSLEGWQTRETGTLRALRGWQTREEKWIDRQKTLRDEEDYWKEQIDTIQADIAHEEDRLTQKRQRVKMVQAQITIVSITVSIKAGVKYEKRFQGFYLIDAIRDPETGLFNLDVPLTQDELAICIDDFYRRWNWIGVDGEPELPFNTTTPRLTDISSFELITEAQGAWFLKCSVIFEGEEETFGNRQLIYSPSLKEKERFRKYAQT